MADSSHTKRNIQNRQAWIAFRCRQSSSLQLSFTVASIVAVSVSACICSFFSNPFAFTNVPLLPPVFRLLLPIRFLFAAATFRFLFPLGFRFPFVVAGSSCRRPREPHKF
ncbi:hypothetical protein [Methanimicrococcus hongohii]|uniref:hypothetical protein n=1 Tax=Methanimicrococcus hongohii TaxID=3028295 RepID=UPI00292E3D36|nr:hypothetical protein [Methanimicrococcus sp. Hf6]